ncbi:MAG TPA: FAD-dependent oxidoreductase [Solirubrobacteraceae bacterium]|nr:FAD-dependent oxidoreductase [Solirubrobacteraceae bacterium]
MVGAEAQVAVIGGGVVGCAVAHALARRGVGALLLEADDELASGASGANSGVLHTGFDSPPGELETHLILRAAALREELLDELAVPVWRCGALLEPRSSDERAAVARLAENARANGVAAALGADGSLSVPDESVTDPVAFTRALAAAAGAGGARIRLGALVTRLASAAGGVTIELDSGERLYVSAAVNCAGLHADELARSAGDDLVEVYPRKGEFLVFAQQQPVLDQILLPVPSALGKGVLVFPTVDRRAIIAGPTAREREDKRDRAVETDAAELILERARHVYPALSQLEPLGAYAGLRPAGRGANYVIEHSRALPRLIHVAAIRSTGLSASPAIGEHVLGMLARAGAIAPGPARALPTPAPAPASDAPEARTEAWWERAARRSGESARGCESGSPPGAA